MSKYDDGIAERSPRRFEQMRYAYLLLAGRDADKQETRTPSKGGRCPRPVWDRVNRTPHRGYREAAKAAKMSPGVVYHSLVRAMKGKPSRFRWGPPPEDGAED